ncbi:hypothetical protein C1I63_11975 [Rathayibacter caricis DSM 15933]|uniref:Glycosyltransferase 2-like domain-containing protein n=1 Tax=Rathayibacter caricis DSM 15933 TaxID=1328867 RepID=A0A2T4UVD2_9MICO|nr:glycosyltransferase family A protein [Rathayibacter caricis]PTL73492.1 hypothetical protein C1I63_11975 [Rathayibacter caricis DSM 15933]
MTVTCVIPTHDRDSLLPRAVRSAAAQTLPPESIIVVDDVPRAETRALVEGLAAETDVPVIYLDASASTRRTAGSSRNAGAALAESELLAFLDDDDIWDPAFLEEAVATLESEEVDFVVGWTKYRREDREGRGLSMPGGLSPHQALAVNPGLTGSNTVVRTVDFRRIDGFDPELPVANDLDFLYRLLCSGSTYAVLRERLVVQVFHRHGHLSSRTAARAEGLRRYMRKHSAALTWSDRRKIRRLIHSALRGHDRPIAVRAFHFLLQTANTDVRQFWWALEHRLHRRPTHWEGTGDER